MQNQSVLSLQLTSTSNDIIIVIVVYDAKNLILLFMLIILTLYYIMDVGRNCIGCAKTGSGKTAAFALPILQQLAKEPFGIYALILTPTRFVL